MTAKEAVAKRILQLCDERNIAVNALANISGVSPSTVYSMLNEKSQNPGVVSLQKLCDGLEISLRQFFDSELFDNLEQEIKKNFGGTGFLCRLILITFSLQRYGLYCIILTVAMAVALRRNPFNAAAVFFC